LARFLAIDWEQDQVHVVQAQTGRGGVRVEQALSWTLPEPLTATSGEALGKKLRDALKEANVAAAPVLACVGRERVILKELRYPPVPTNEEPAIVRFQAAKELTESIEDCIVDYTYMGNGQGDGERHAMAVIVRKEVVNSMQALCRGLGMKLLLMTPRPGAVIGALDRSRQGKVEVGAVEALLSIGSRWADLGILRGQTLLFARSLGVGATLAAEVRRSLAVFNAGSETAVSALYVASDGDETALCGRLRELLNLPVHYLDAFLPADTVQIDKARRGRFTAAIGLLQRWSEKPELGINFVAPKEPKAAENPRRRQKVLLGVVAAVVAVFLIIFGNMLLSDKKAKIAELNIEKADEEAKVKKMAQEAADIAGIKEWDNTTISWLDELWDLTARFPNLRGLKVDSITASTNSSKKQKEKFVATMTINGVTPDLGKVNELVTAMNKSGLRARLDRFDPGQATGQIKFQVNVDLVHQKPSDYTTKLVLPKTPALATGAGDDDVTNQDAADADGDDDQ